MILANWQLLLEEPFLFVRIMGSTILGLILAVTVHEASHALLATVQGDHTAQSNGRLSLNPVAHLDPTGSVLMLLVGFGWGKPVPVNPFWLKYGPRLGTALVAMAGPFSNIFTAALLAAPIRLGLVAWHTPFSYVPFAQTTPSWILADVLGIMIFYNLILAVFNLLPLSPLDGFNVVAGLLPQNLGERFSQLAPYGPGILMTLVLLSYIDVFNFSMWNILGPVVRAISLVVVGRTL